VRKPGGEHEAERPRNRTKAARARGWSTRFTCSSACGGSPRCVTGAGQERQPRLHGAPVAGRTTRTGVGAHSGPYEVPAGPQSPPAWPAGVRATLSR
jgi:hypothetical protein